MPMIAATINQTPYLDAIRKGLSHCLTKTAFKIDNLQNRYQGKARDCYDLGNQLLIVATDRLSAFDRMIATIPYKGQVLNLLSAWWFTQVQTELPHHMLGVPDPNAMLAKKCQVFPIEFVVRGFITGTTSTSLWTQYQQGQRKYCGIHFQDGLQKNQAFNEPILTPTTKEQHHDRLISAQEIIAEKILTQAEWDELSAKALHLFRLGTSIAAKKGLILVDSKYEFGRDDLGIIVIVDELHTPDSSRYWLLERYAHCFAQGKEPDHFDKELLRLWFASHCNPYQDEVLPAAPTDLILLLALRYIQLYEMLTGQTFHLSPLSDAQPERIMQNSLQYLRTHSCAAS